MSTEYLGSHKSPRTGELLRYRRMRLQDLPVVDALCAEHGFELGVRNWHVLWHSTQSSWEVCENSQGDIVAARVTNLFAPELRYYYMAAVRSDYQKHGIMSHMQLARGEGEGKMYSNNANTVQATNHWNHDTFFDRKLSFNGTVDRKDVIEYQEHHSPPLPSNIIIRDITSDDIKSIKEFDEELLTFRRTKFLELWTQPEQLESGALGTATCIALHESRCIGWACIRAMDDGFMLTPVYAQSAQVAISLMISCLLHLPEESFVWTPVMADRASVHHLMQHLGLVQCEWEVKCTSSGAAAQLMRNINKHWVYCPHEFWPT